MAAWTQGLIIAYAFLVGAAVGSFLNVVIHRVPRRRSVVRPRSACPDCGAAIRWYDNVPILSWIVLGGRCRDCRRRISVRYPLVELAAALAAAGALARWGVTVSGVEVALFAWASLALGLIDLEHQLLPDVITYPCVLLGLAAAWLGGLTPLRLALLGAVVGAVLPTLVIVLYKALRGVEGMGWGDVKYLAAIGAVAGVQGCLWILVLAAVLGALVGIGLVLSGRGSGQTALPFGTFLAAATLVWLYLPATWQTLPTWAG